MKMNYINRGLYAVRILICILAPIFLTVFFFRIIKYQGESWGLLVSIVFLFIILWFLTRKFHKGELIIENFNKEKFVIKSKPYAFKKIFSYEIDWMRINEFSLKEINYYTLLSIKTKDGLSLKYAVEDLDEKPHYKAKIFKTASNKLHKDIEDSSFYEKIYTWKDVSIAVTTLLMMIGWPIVRHFMDWSYNVWIVAFLYLTGIYYLYKFIKVFNDNNNSNTGDS